MIGIDIVDLHDPKLRERTDRALDLILHPADTYPQHTQLFWLVWTAKEAIFKCNRKANTFSPSTLQVNINETSQNEFHFNSLSITGVIHCNHYYVLAIASKDHTPVYQLFYSKDTCKSHYIRNKISSHLAPSQRLTEDPQGLPVINPSGKPVSITHHYHYAAFAI